METLRGILEVKHNMNKTENCKVGQEKCEGSTVATANSKHIYISITT